MLLQSETRPRAFGLTVHHGRWRLLDGTPDKNDSRRGPSRGLASVTTIAWLSSCERCANLGLPANRMRR